jgi:hypothetical protein
MRHWGKRGRVVVAVFVLCKGAREETVQYLSPLPPLAAEHMPKKPNLPQSEPNPSLISGFIVRIAKRPDTFSHRDIRE